MIDENMIDRVVATYAAASGILGTPGAEAKPVDLQELIEVLAFTAAMAIEGNAKQVPLKPSDARELAAMVQKRVLVLLNHFSKAHAATGESMLQLAATGIAGWATPLKPN